jgi:ABC-2 type transport system ATP-binding protein
LSLEGPILETNSLTKVYPPRRKDLRSPRDLWDKITGKEGGNPVTALKDFDLNVKRQEVFGLVGPNGAGKTTLCKILNALVLPTSGSAKIDGFDVISEHGQVCRRVFPLFGGETDMWGIFAGRLNILKNLRFVARIWRVPASEIENRIEHSLKVLRIEEKKDEWYQKLSAGEKQKTWLAAMMTVRPRLAVLDEPTIKLDVGTRRQFYDVLRDELRDEFGSSIFITTHNLHEAETLCDRVGIINKGRLVAVDRPNNLKRYVTQERESTILLRTSQEGLESVLGDLRKIEVVSSAEIAETKAEEEIQQGHCKLSIRMDKVEGEFQEVLDLLKGHGIPVVTVWTKEVSLEDAFIQLTEEGLTEET